MLNPAHLHFSNQSSMTQNCFKELFMANSKQRGGNNNGGQSKQGGSIKGPDCAKDSIAHRQAIRKEEARLAQARQALKATGEFFLKKNDGRETDIFKIEAGVIGEYAIPGGDKPSVHVRVTDMGTPEKPFPVIYFDQAHEGSGLPGNLSKDTFLPVWTLSQDSFTTKMSGFYGQTQSQMFSFLTGAIDDTRVQMAKNQEEKTLIATVNKSSKDLHGIKRGQLGLYAVIKEEGTVIFSVFMAKHMSVSVFHSTYPDLTTSKAFLPIKLFDYAELRQVTTDEIYEGQLAIFNFLKPLLDGLVEEEQAEVMRPNLRIVETTQATTSPVTKTEQEVAPVSVKQISVKQVMAGSTGIAVFTSGEQSLTVNVHDKQTPKGHVRFFEVTAKSGFVESVEPSVEVGTYVIAEQLIAQAISKADMAGLPPKSISTKLALIAFIMMARKGVKFCKLPSAAILPKPTSLQLVA